MRRIKFLLFGVTLALFFTPISNVFASAQDFIIEDFTADYYLTKLEDGTSRLHVKEVQTVNFLKYDHSHGITKNIPFLNQGGMNIVIESQEAMGLTVFRNGKPEEISKIDIEDDYYKVYIGDVNEYVNGEQVYTLEYDFTDIITEFDEKGNNVSGDNNVVEAFQELYWDTIGTSNGAEVSFVTANLHLDDGVLENVNISDTRCYVGGYGRNNENRCTFEVTKDGFTFKAIDLDVGENLTFAVDFAPGTFEVIVEDNYILIAILVIEILVGGIIFICKYLKWRNVAKSQYKSYKNIFVIPQYQAPNDKYICVAEGEQIYIKKTKTSYVATLLELAVEKKITIKKAGDKNNHDWIVILNVDPDSLNGPQKEILNILSGDGKIARHSEIPIKKRNATRYLADCVKEYKKVARKVLVNRGYLADANEKKNKDDDKSKWLIIYNRISFFLFLITFGIGFLLVGFSIIVIMSEKVFGLSGNARMIGGLYAAAAIPIILMAIIVIVRVMNRRIEKYSAYTEKGIKLARYLEGLELYIKMAEADRLKFLQSVDGVDTSNEGIVKLYEKLLPWASLFGAERSWAKELNKYYEIEDMDAVVDIDVLDAIAVSDMVYSINNDIDSSTRYIEVSSGGGSSSWSSGGGGGGGGGFSGGGGGGGGTGSW